MSNLLINKLKRLKSESIRPQTLPRARALREPLILRSRRGIHNGSGPVKQLRRTAVLLDVLEQQNSLPSLLLKQQVISIGKPLFLLGRTVYRSSSTTSGSQGRRRVRWPLRGVSDQVSGLVRRREACHWVPHWCSSLQMWERLEKLLCDLCALLTM